MVKLKTQELDGFVDQPGAKFVAALLYGEDAGLVRERANRLALAIVDNPADPFRVADLSIARLKDEPSLLVDEMLTVNLTGDQRLVRLENAGNGQAEAIEVVLNHPAITPTSSFLIIKATALGPRDRLRKLFENHDRGVAIPCYLDNSISLEKVIHHSLGQYGLKIHPTAVAYLCENLGTDRQVTRSELEKLALYKGKIDGEITLHDAVSVIGDGAPLAREDVAFATAAGDQVALDRALFKCRTAGEQPVVVLRVVIKHFQKLHLLALKIADGDDVSQLIRSQRPPIFFKHQPIIKHQLLQWRPSRLARALGILTQAEMDCKTTGLPAEAICGRALIRIAHAVSPRSYK